MKNSASQVIYGLAPISKCLTYHGLVLVTLHMTSTQLTPQPTLKLVYALYYEMSLFR